MSMDLKTTASPVNKSHCYLSTSSTMKTPSRIPKLHSNEAATDNGRNTDMDFKPLFYSPSKLASTAMSRRYPPTQACGSPGRLSCSTTRLTAVQQIPVNQPQVSDADLQADAEDVSKGCAACVVHIINAPVQTTPKKNKASTADVTPAKASPRSSIKTGAAKTDTDNDQHQSQSPKLSRATSTTSLEGAPIGAEPADPAAPSLEAPITAEPTIAAPTASASCMAGTVSAASCKTPHIVAASVAAAPANTVSERPYGTYPPLTISNMFAGSTSTSVTLIQLGVACAVIIGAAVAAPAFIICKLVPHRGFPST